MVKVKTLEDRAMTARDTFRIYTILLERGYEATLTIAQDLWADYCRDKYGHYWVSIASDRSNFIGKQDIIEPEKYTDDTIFENIEPFINPIF